jgi:ribosomal protein S20
LRARPLVVTFLELERRSATLARTPRKWQGARNPSGLKRVRQAERRRAILQPRRSAAKTLVAKAVTVSTTQSGDADANAVALTEAISALDRAAKTGAIHPNAAARRKSRLVRKVNAALGGTVATGAGHVTKTTGKAAAAKAAKARIAAGKAVKAKGAQTAAGKARAALSRTTRSEGSHGTAATATPAAEAAAPAKPAAKATTKAPAKSTAAKSTAAKAPAKSTARASTTTKASASKTTKAAAEKAPAKATRAKKTE